MGYTLAQPIKILDAALFGAPQKRKRLILIGSRNDVTKADYPPATHSLETTTNKDNNKLAPTYLNPNTTADAISDLATIPPFIGTDKGVEAAKLDYSGFRKNFALTPSENINFATFVKQQFHLSLPKRNSYGDILVPNIPRKQKPDFQQQNQVL